MDCLQAHQPHGHTCRQPGVFQINQQTFFAQIPGVADLIPAVLGADIIRAQEGNEIAAFVNMPGDVLIPFRSRINSFVVPDTKTLFLQFADHLEHLLHILV